MKNTWAKLPHGQGEGFANNVRTDQDFRARLIEDPKTALSEFGLAVPDGIEVKPIVDTDNEKYLHVPMPPAEGEISELDMMEAQGGTTPGCIATVTVVSIISLTVSGAVSFDDTF
ncbi:MAG: nitrile hydratase subunit alpha [Paracoccaceae bacterium]